MTYLRIMSGRWSCRGFRWVVKQIVTRVGWRFGTLIVVLFVLYLGSIGLYAGVSGGHRYPSGFECVVESGRAWIWYGRGNEAPDAEWKWDWWFGSLPVSAWRVDFAPGLKWADHGVWMERGIVIPLWMPLALVIGVQVWRGWRYKPWQCPKCRYDLRGLDGGVCPECGEALR